jgi:hypothetical protein
MKLLTIFELATRSEKELHVIYRGHGRKADHSVLVKSYRTLF